MSVSVSVRSYTHSITYVTDNVLRSLKEIIRQSGLSPEKLAIGWASLELAIRTWIESGDLMRVVLEIFDPKTNGLLTRWDVEISYGYTDDDGYFFVDTDAIRSAIHKTGVQPSTAGYDFTLTTRYGRPDVKGWGPGSLRSIDGMIEQRIGTSIEAAGLSGSISYYRRL